MGYPVSLTLTGRPVVVVGGGRVATRRVAGLVSAGALVTVVAPDLSAALEAQVEAGEVVVERRRFESRDLDGAWAVFAVTDDRAVNRAVLAAAEERCCFASSADGNTEASMAPMAVVRRGALEVAVGTSGHVPGLAAGLARHLGSRLGPEYGVLCDLASDVRRERRAAGLPAAAPDWPAVLDSGILEFIRTGNWDDAREGLRRCHSSSSG